MGHLIDGPAHGQQHPGLHHEHHELAEVNGRWCVNPQEWQAPDLDLLAAAKDRWQTYRRREDTWGLRDQDAVWVFDART